MDAKINLHLGVRGIEFDKMVNSKQKDTAPAEKQVNNGKLTVTVIVAASLIVTVGMTYVLYTTMQDVFRAGIDERLKGLAGAASVSFSTKELDIIGHEESVGTPAYEQSVIKLQHIRLQIPNIRFAYIFRQTDDPNTLEFVADADSLHPDQEVDLNKDGIINDEDALAYPGDPYDVSEISELREIAFKSPAVDREFVQDQWGITLSGYAPIRDPNLPEKSAKYAIGLDLEITQFWKMVQRIIIPFIGFSVFLFLVIVFLAFSLRNLWKRQVHQMAELDRQKDELIGIVSHQLASPISSVQWSLQGVLDGDFGPISNELKKHMELDSKTTANLLDLAKLLLDVSRIELGRLKMNKQKHSLSEFFHEIITVIEPKAKEKNITFKRSIPASLPEGMFDKRLTHMTIENLLTNAVKYTPEKGKVELTVSVRSSVLSCIVKDTGIGIPKKDQAELFGKLFRASNVQSIEGNGFGLYVAKGAIEQQGGSIRFESEEGKGTAFFVELPV
ncbi:TPA: HAMP domain-containing histidine kinase [Candidatus Micrarchaeota archaeon]|nr:HAMP domain-containing histidine kinase [Candidatus Micrarchaeota archaeon]